MSQDKDRIRELEATVRLLAHRVSMLEAERAGTELQQSPVRATAARAAVSKRDGGLYSPPATPPNGRATAASATIAPIGGPHISPAFGSTPLPVPAPVAPPPPAAAISPLPASILHEADPLAAMLETPRPGRFIAPVLAPSQQDTASEAASGRSGPQVITPGTRVRIHSDKEYVMSCCQSSTVGWRTSKEAMLGLAGTVTETDITAARVRLNGGQECWFPKTVLQMIPALRSPPGGASVKEDYDDVESGGVHSGIALLDDLPRSAGLMAPIPGRNRSPTPPRDPLLMGADRRAISPPPPPRDTRRASGTSTPLPPSLALPTPQTLRDSSLLYADSTSLAAYSRTPIAGRDGGLSGLGGVGRSAVLQTRSISMAAIRRAAETPRQSPGRRFSSEAAGLAPRHGSGSPQGSPSRLSRRASGADTASLIEASSGESLVGKDRSGYTSATSSRTSRTSSRAVNSALAGLHKALRDLSDDSGRAVSPHRQRRT